MISIEVSGSLQFERLRSSYLQSWEDFSALYPIGKENGGEKYYPSLEEELTAIV